MKRDIIIIEDKTVCVTGNEVWMTAGEIAEEFHATVPAVNAAHQSRPQVGRAERLRGMPLHTA